MSLFKSFFGSRAGWPKPPLETRLYGPRLVLRAGYPTDWREWRDVRSASRDFLVPWEPTWPIDALSYEFFCGLLRRQARDWREGKAYAFLIFLKPSEAPQIKASSPHISTLSNLIPANHKNSRHSGQVANVREPREPESHLFSTNKQGNGMPASAGMTESNGGPLLIGGVSLNGMQRGIAQKGTLGYWIGEPFARQGYMTEAVSLVCDFAFNTLKLNRVEAGCLPRNEASCRLLAKLGFAQEGFARAYLRINGKWEDHILWGRVREN